MFWRERQREINKDQNGGPPCGQLRVLVVGDSGVGKTSLVNLIVKGTTTNHPPQTIGCAVDEKDKNKFEEMGCRNCSNRDILGPTSKRGPGGLPVPFIVIGNKADVASKEGTRGSSGNLVDMALQWVEKQGLLSSNEELPLIDSIPGSGGLMAVRFGSSCHLMLHATTGLG
ncbi:hypothetical protein L1987_81074 [Smallanthus sonchifolius]|uniref:Uncharacterized protein n=1 Tax=Smallanthus sonchifolius TaxID=185202 RepID=A0ACB8YPW1_9ASTR|nr:hypothetical protein L1987_81074 [Smallanthus sonchifolius]